MTVKEISDLAIRAVASARSAHKGTAEASDPHTALVALRIISELDDSQPGVPYLTKRELAAYSAAFYELQARSKQTTGRMVPQRRST